MAYHLLAQVVLLVGRTPSVTGPAPMTPTIFQDRIAGSGARLLVCRLLDRRVLDANDLAVADDEG